MSFQMSIKICIGLEWANRRSIDNEVWFNKMFQKRTNLGYWVVLIQNHEATRIKVSAKDNDNTDKLTLVLLCSTVNKNSKKYLSHFVGDPWKSDKVNGGAFPPRTPILFVICSCRTKVMMLGSYLAMPCSLRIDKWDVCGGGSRV